MSNGDKERPEVGVPVEKPEEKGINLSSLPSAQPVENGPRFSKPSDIIPEVTDFAPGESPVKIEGNKISIDKTALETEKNKVIEDFKKGIEEGNEGLIKSFLWYYEDREDEEGIKQRDAIKEALAKKDASSLKFDAIQVNLPTEAIAQRRIIREKLKTEIQNYPFTFKDKDGNPLDSENDIDFVFASKGDGSGFKLMVGSKKGIAGVGVPQSLGDEKFKPDLTKMEKDVLAGKISIPVKKAGNGTLPSVSILEIYQGAVDINAQLLKEEEERERAQRQQPQFPPSTPSYTPPPVSPRPAPRASRPTTWVPVSH